MNNYYHSIIDNSKRICESNGVTVSSEAATKNNSLEIINISTSQRQVNTIWLQELVIYCLM